MALKPKTVQYERRRGNTTVKVRVTYLRDHERLDKAVEIALAAQNNPMTPVPLPKPASA